MAATSYSNGYSHSNSHNPAYGLVQSATNSYSPYNRPPSPSSAADSPPSASQRLLARLRIYWHGRGKNLAWNFLMQAARRVKANLAARRLLSFPHLLVLLWMLVMLWGERWAFTRQVQSCDWDHWEDWVSPYGRSPSYPRAHSS